MAFAGTVPAGGRGSRRPGGAARLIARYSIAALGSDRELPGVGALADDHVPVQIGAIHPGSVSTSESEGAYGRMSVRIPMADGNHRRTGIDCGEKARELT
jgi:hypothetical protein